MRIKFIFIFVITLIVNVLLFYFGNSYLSSRESVDNGTQAAKEQTRPYTTKQYLLDLEACKEKQEWAGEHSSRSECLEHRKNYRNSPGKGSAIPRNIGVKEKFYRILLGVCYLFLCLAFTTQISIFLYSFLVKRFINRRFFYLSDWATNSPTVAGIMGTLCALAIAHASSDGAPLNTVISEQFEHAILTTIMGGFIYIINLFLTIKILPEVKNRK